MRIMIRACCVAIFLLSSLQSALAEDRLPIIDMHLPKLKVYLMHSGERFYDDALALMLQHPQVYSDQGTTQHPL